MTVKAIVIESTQLTTLDNVLKGAPAQYVITTNGTIRKGHDLALDATEVRVMYIGSKKGRTDNQKLAIAALTKELRQRFPDAKVNGPVDEIVTEPPAPVEPEKEATDVENPEQPTEEPSS